VRIPLAIRQANAPKAQKPVVELDIDPTEAWIRWASGLHLSPRFDRFAYNVPFLTHLVNLIGEDPEPEEVAEPAPEAGEETERPLLHRGLGNTQGVEAKHVLAWVQLMNVSRQDAADILGWHRSSVVKILSHERLVTETQAVRFREVIRGMEHWQRLQYEAMLEGIR
jgi:hypothetical protein